MPSVYFVSVRHHLVIDIKHRKLPNKPSHWIRIPRILWQATNKKKKESLRIANITKIFVLLVNNPVEYITYIVYRVHCTLIFASAQQGFIPFWAGKLMEPIFILSFDQMFVMLCNVPIYLHLLSNSTHFIIFFFTFRFFFVNIFWLIQQTMQKALCKEFFFFSSDIWKKKRRQIQSQKCHLEKDDSSLGEGGNTRAMEPNE